MQFKTSNGEIVTGDKLQLALNNVAQWQRENAQAIYDEDEYASHVTKETKLANLHGGLKLADEIEHGQHLHNFTIAQRINIELTGKCIPFFGDTSA